MLRATIRGPSGWAAALWYSRALREEPADTRYGAFHLLTEPDGRPNNRPDLPFQFDRLPFASAGSFGADGVWQLERVLGADLSSIETIYVQAGVLDGESQLLGAMTEVLKLVVPIETR